MRITEILTPTSAGVTDLFAARFAEERNKASISQQRVALLMSEMYGFHSWHQTTVAKVEAGQRDVKLAEAFALAEIVRVPLDKLLQGRGESVLVDQETLTVIRP